MIKERIVKLRKALNVLSKDKLNILSAVIGLDNKRLELIATGTIDPSITELTLLEVHSGNLPF